MNQKNILVFVGVTLVVGGSVALAARTLLRPQAPTYQYLSPTTHRLEERVQATGVVKPAQSVDLSFERGGRIALVQVNVGDTVRVGQPLVELDHTAESALVSQASALLRQREAGTSESEVAIYQAAVEAARADLEKTKTDTAASVSVAQAALESAQNNLRETSLGEESQIVVQAYQNVIASLQATVPKLDNALMQSDAVLGVDSIGAAIGFQNVLSVLDASRLPLALQRYQEAKALIVSVRAQVGSLSEHSSHASIEATLQSQTQAMTAATQLLSAVTDVLNATVSGTTLSATDLASKKAAIQAARTDLATQATLLVAAKQSVINAKNSLAGNTIGFNKASQDLTNAKASAASLIAVKQSIYQQAVANLENKRAPVRAVDLAPLRASVSAAASAYQKTILVSPLAGIVSRQEAKVGAIVTPNASLVSIINEQSLQLEILVPETDLAKLHLGDTAQVTLDAYGSEDFAATIVALDPTATNQTGVSGYRVTLQFTNHDERIKAGMTGNATILVSTKEALALPNRSILQHQDVYTVLVRDAANQVHERSIRVGVKGVDGWWEVVSGLEQNEQVVDLGH